MGAAKARVLAPPDKALTRRNRMFRRSAPGWPPRPRSVVFGAPIALAARKTKSLLYLWRPGWAVAPAGLRRGDPGGS